MKYTFLSKKFYEDYPHEKYEQIEMKENRPYVHVHVDIYGKLFCIPMRSNIDHPHAYFTDKKNKCGVDYSKAVVITKPEHIDNSTKVFLRQNEHNKLNGKDYKIKTQFLEYIELYKKAKLDDTIPHREKILKFSTLQYFEKHIYTSEADNKLNT